MKTIKHIFLLLLTMSIMVCCEKETVEQEITEISLSDNYRDVYLKKRGHWGSMDNRIYTYSYDEKVIMRGCLLTLKFEKEVVDLRILIMDTDNQVILDEIISGDKKSSYIIPIEFTQDKWYTIMVSNNSDYLYLPFTITL